MILQLLETQRQSWQTGHPRQVEDFLREHPTLRDSPEDLRELIYQEILLGSQSDAPPTLPDYAERFPDFSADLPTMFELRDQQATTVYNSLSFSQATATHQPSEATGQLPQIGDYELIHEIARGGMGVVYKARQLSANRIVALKMIRAGNLAGPDDVRRFRVEAEAAASLDHPGIVPVFDVGTFDDQNYFSMGYVDGPSLQQHLAHGPVEPRSAAHLVRTIAEAIVYAHGRGVVHRDLKPANVLLAGDGYPRLTDFGLAKRMGEDSGLTMTGQVMGTPAYMAPEQAAGRLADVGPPSDQYSLGAILYHAVTGSPPFQASSIAKTIEHVQYKEPVPPRKLNPHVDADLNTIILRTLEKDHRARYASVGDLIAELTRYLEGRPILARPLSPAGRALRWSKRNPVVASLLSLLVLGTVAAAISASLVVLEFEDKAETEQSLRQQGIALTEDKRAAQEREQLAKSAEAEARAKAADTDLHAARVRYAAESQKCSAVFEQPQLAGPIAGLHLDYWHPGAWEIRGDPDAEPHIFADLDTDPDFRGWEFFMLSALTNTDTEKTAGFSTTSKFTSATAASGDGRLAFATMTGITVATALDHRSAKFTPVDQTKIYRLDFHPDGDRIASAGKDGTVRVWEVGAKVGAELHRLEHGAPVNFVAFAGDGDQLVSHGRDGIAHVWDLRTLSRQTTIKDLPEHCALAVSPDGDQLAVGVKPDPDTNVVKLFDTTTGDLVDTFGQDGHSDSIQWIDFSPDGSRLATASSDSTVLVWDTKTKAVTLRMTRHKLKVFRVAWSPDGKSLASAGEDQIVRVWDAETGEQLRHFTRHRTRVVGLLWSGSGDYLYSAAEDTKFVINDLAAPTPITQFQIPDAKRGAKPVALHWNPASDKLSATLGAHHTQIDLGTATAAPTPHSHHQCWSPDGIHHAYLNGGQLVVSADDATIGTCEVDPLTFAHLQWSPATPPRLAFLDGEEVKVWDIATPTPHVLYTMQDIDCLGWKPDGRQLAVSSGEDEIQILDADSGESLANFHSSPPNHGLSEAYAVRWNADGSTFAAAVRSNDAVVFDSLTWAVRSKLDHGLPVKDLAWSPAGQTRRLATASDDNKIRIWDPQDSLLLLTLPHPNPVQRVSWSPDGKKIASMDYTGLVQIWDASHGYVARKNIDDEIARKRR